MTENLIIIECIHGCEGVMDDLEYALKRMDESTPRCIMHGDKMLPKLPVED